MVRTWQMFPLHGQIWTEQPPVAKVLPLSKYVQFWLEVAPQLMVTAKKRALFYY